jgi:hypothetical protein
MLPPDIAMIKPGHGAGMRIQTLRNQLRRVYPPCRLHRDRITARLGFPRAAGDSGRCRMLGLRIPIMHEFRVAPFRDYNR